jgi:hypothetical protein
MRLGEFRVLYNARYNHRAIHDTERDRWTVEEQCQVSFFGLRTPWRYWSELKEPAYDSQDTIYFATPEEAFDCVERILNGNVRGKTIKTVVTEANHERIN